MRENGDVVKLYKELSGVSVVYSPPEVMVVRRFQSRVRELLSILDEKARMCRDAGLLEMASELQRLGDQLRQLFLLDS